LRIKAVIFDLDGTLVDSIQGIAYSLNRMLAENGFPVHSVEECKNMVGNGFIELVRRALPENHRSDEEISRCLSRLREIYGRHFDYGMYVYDGMTDLLEYLQSHNVRFAVDTNKDEGVAREIMQRFFPGFSFFRVAGTTPDMPKKPNPARALSILSDMGVSPVECIYLGDSEVDIITAKNAGVMPVSAAWGFRGAERLAAAGAENIIQKPMELVRYLV